MIRENTSSEEMAYAIARRFERDRGKDVQRSSCFEGESMSKIEIGELRRKVSRLQSKAQDVRDLAEDLMNAIDQAEQQ